jgi:hypothetical protein
LAAVRICYDEQLRVPEGHPLYRHGISRWREPEKTIARLTVFPLAWKDGYTRGFARRVNMLHKDRGFTATSNHLLIAEQL